MKMRAAIQMAQRSSAVIGAVVLGDRAQPSPTVKGSVLTGEGGTCATELSSDGN
jgi:hypothetical protein